MLNPRIYQLAFGTFTVGTEGYVVAGVLPELAHDLHSSVPACGQLVTVFALAYALLGPPLIGRLHRVPPRRLLVLAALVFALANLAAAVAPDFGVLVAARVVAAAGAALFMAPAATFAAALTEPQLLPRAIAVTATGNALALTAGAPIGTLVASAFGWRAAFGFVAVLALAAAALVGTKLPAVAATDAPRGRLDLLGTREIRWAVATTFGLFLAAYTLYTYLAPVVRTATGRGSAVVAALMVVFGAGGLLGGRIAGRALARHHLARVLHVALTVVALALVVVALATARCGPSGVRLALLFPTMVALGAAWWSGGISQQTRFALAAPDQRSTALSLHFSAQFLGVAAAGALGGAALAVGSAVVVPVVAAVVALTALLGVRHLPAQRAAEVRT